MYEYNYITPNLIKYDSYEELTKKKNIFKGLFDFYDEKEKIRFNDLFLLKNAVILAEPGYGKTRLLKEIVIEARNCGKYAFYLDLKKVDGSIEEYITKKSANAKIVDNLMNEFVIYETFLLKTTEFHLEDNSNFIVCLDALDEVKQDKFSNIIDYIKEFTRIYPNLKIVISCRSHHFYNQKKMLEDLNLTFIEICQFSRKQVKNYLQNSNVNDEDVEKIFDNLEQSGRELMIQTPRYLNILTTLLIEKGVTHVLKITKIELIEWFVYKELDSDEEINKKKDIIKRLLEKLALIMEIYQTNIITKDELMTFFDDIRSDLKITFLQQVDISLFFVRCLLKDNGDSLEFFNSEFQECLAAKEILRLGKIDQIVFDIAVDQELGEFYISWANTLHFLVNRDPKLLSPILNYVSRKNNLAQDEHYHELLTNVNVEQLSIAERRQVFEQVFGYYQQVSNWIGYKVVENLTCFFDKSINEILKGYIDGRNNKGTQCIVRRGNVALLVEFLIKNNILEGHEKEYWKTKLMFFLQDKQCCNNVLQRLTLSALAWYKDITLIKKVAKYIDLTDDLVRQEFLTACKEADANNMFSIQQFIKGIKEGDSIYSRYGLYEVKEPSAVKKLLKNFIEDSSLLNIFLDRENIFEKNQDDVIIQNIKNVWDKEVCLLVKSFIISSYALRNRWLTEKSRLVKSMIILINEHEPYFVFELIEEIKNSSILYKNIFWFIDAFAMLLKKGQVERFYSEFSSIENGKTLVFFTLKEVKYSQRTDAIEIYEEGRKYFKKDYKKLEKRSSTTIQKENASDKYYKTFKSALWIKNDIYNLNIFGYYNAHKIDIDIHITLEDKEKLKEIAIQHVFEKFDPVDGEIYISKNNTDEINYTISVSLEIFRECLKLVNELDIDTSKYRQKIINYIPFAYHEQLEIIFLLIKTPSNQEIKMLLRNYLAEQKDDRKVFRPDSLIETCDKYHIVNAVDILKDFILNDKIEKYIRIRAMEVSTKLSPNESFLMEMFNKYDGITEISELAIKANELLIVGFMNNEAIQWRIEEIKKRVFPHIERKGVHSCNANEFELHEKKFAKPLMNIRDPKYTNAFLALLKLSFDFYEENEKYRLYASYLWEIVASYYDNLKEYRSYKPLLELEEVIRGSLELSEGVNWFLYRVRDLKKSYLNYIGKPQNISDCIKKYNTLKQNQYLDIATPRNLMELIEIVIDEDIQKWLGSEGGYGLQKGVKGNIEELLQKTLKIQIENCLMKRGIRGVDIRREEQLADGRRIDFLISYGFIGPVLIELKRIDNREILSVKEMVEYKSKMLDYIRGTNSYKGIFLMLQTNERYSLDIYLPKVKEVYKDCDNVVVKALNCIGPLIIN